MYNIGLLEIVMWVTVDVGIVAGFSVYYKQGSLLGMIVYIWLTSKDNVHSQFWRSKV